MFLFWEPKSASTNKNNLRSTFERAEVLGQWISEMEKNVVNSKQLICKLDDIRENHVGKYTVKYSFVAHIFIINIH